MIVVVKVKFDGEPWRKLAEPLEFLSLRLKAVWGRGVAS